MLPLKFALSILFLAFLTSCKRTDDVEIALSKAGENRKELEIVLKHYNKPGYELKLKAACYLIKNLPAQYHYEGSKVNKCKLIFGKMDSIIHKNKEIPYKIVWDSLQKQIDTTNDNALKKVYDIEHIKAKFLIKNIDEAFFAWNYPWAKDLSFENFCKYILPYKVKNENPVEWRTYFRKKYSWLPDSLKNRNDAFEACTQINNNLKKWFYLTKLNVPFDLNLDDLLKIKSGKCPQEVQMATYAMRAMGVPVVMDGVPYWANRGSRHDWNALIDDDQSIPFLGTEINPGFYKLEFPYPGSIRSKRAKIYRTTYEIQSNNLPSISRSEEIPVIFDNVLYKDVTNIYVPTSSIQIELNSSITNYNHQFGYLCVFNNRMWKPVDWGSINQNKLNFNNVGAYGILYLPAIYDENDYIPAGNPFILYEKGLKKIITPNLSRLVSFEIDRKYPSGDDNYINIGQHYELLFWSNEWRSIKKITATEKTLIFNNVPDGALLWLKNLDEGVQERVFTLEKGKICWW